jgi:hypothetical protein
MKIKGEHETGERSYSYDQIMTYAVNKFHLMVHKGEWNPGKGSVDDRLLELETRTNGRILKKDRNKNKQQGGGSPAIKEIDPSRYAPKGGNWETIPPNKGGPSVKAKITRKSRSGERLSTGVASRMEGSVIQDSRECISPRIANGRQSKLKRIGRSLRMIKRNCSR